MANTEAIVVVNTNEAGECKALTEVSGRPVVGYLIGNLRACEAISRVIVVSDGSTPFSGESADAHVVAGGGEAEMVMAGMREAAGASKCLLMGGDMPLATPEAISDFLTASPEADIVYPIVGRSDLESAFPGRHASYMKTTEGQFAGSSCLSFRPEAALAKERLLISLLEARKNPVALLGLIGPKVGLKMMFSTLSLRDLEQALSHALNLDCRVFITHYPELLMSIDSPSDIDMIRRTLGE